MSLVGNRRIGQTGWHLATIRRHRGSRALSKRRIGPVGSSSLRKTPRAGSSRTECPKGLRRRAFFSCRRPYRRCGRSRPRRKAACKFLESAAPRPGAARRCSTAPGRSDGKPARQAFPWSFRHRRRQRSVAFARRGSLACRLFLRIRRSHEPFQLPCSSPWPARLPGRR